MSQSNMSSTLRTDVVPATAYAPSSVPLVTPATTATAAPPSAAPAQPFQPQPSMANKQPVEAANVDADTASRVTHPVLVLPGSAPQLVQQRSEKHKLVRTATVTRSLYQIPATLKCAQLAEQGKGILTITIETRAQLSALCAYLKDGPVLKDGTPVHALSLKCDFEKLQRQKNSEWVEPGALMQTLLDSALCVKSLDLKACTLKNEDYQSLSAFLAQPESMLEALYLDNCFMSDAAAQEFASGLENHPRLQTFSLQGACMLQPGWASVLFALATCKQLATLVIHPTAAGNLPMDVMAYVLEEVGTLRSLECSCGPRLSLYPERASAEWRSDFGAFCQSVAKHTSLVALELQGSDLSSADIDRLVLAAEKSGSIDRLGIGTNLLNHDQTRRMGAALARNGASNRRKAGPDADVAPMTTAINASMIVSSSTSSTSASSSQTQ